MTPLVGVLAIQGGFLEHERILSRLGIPCREVRGLKDVKDLTGFIIPGGESTVMDLFLSKDGLKNWLVDRVQSDPNFAVMGTCAGLILLARYGLLDAEVERNAYGRQVDSFIADLLVEGAAPLLALRGHFIRAPKVISVGSRALVLAHHLETPVLLRQGRVWGLSFHPELADDERLHAAVFS